MKTKHMKNRHPHQTQIYNGCFKVWWELFLIRLFCPLTH